MEPNKTQKLTGIDAITSTLNRGSVGDQVKALQQYLIGLGYTGVKPNGVFGPVTESAVKQFQIDNGLSPDGDFGPLSLNKAKTVGGSSATSGVPGSGKAPDDPSYMYNTQTGEINEKFIPKTQEELDSFYNASALSNPIFAGNSPESLAYAASTGDFTGLMDTNGKPFSDLVQKEALLKAEEALKPGFEAAKRYDTAGTESELAQKKLDYEKYLAGEKENFQEEKTALDQSAADRGVLFSGGRAEKERKLQDTYRSNLDYNRTSLGNTIGGIARGYQYAYGDKAAESPELSKYYQLGGNTYNANVARGGVGSSPLSNVYNGGNYDFQGTKVNANKAAVNVRAASLLANKGNKLLSTSYQNKF